MLVPRPLVIIFGKKEFNIQNTYYSIKKVHTTNKKFNNEKIHIDK